MSRFKSKILLRSGFYLMLEKARTRILLKTFRQTSLPFTHFSEGGESHVLTGEQPSRSQHDHDVSGFIWLCRRHVTQFQSLPQLQSLEELQPWASATSTADRKYSRNSVKPGSDFSNHTCWNRYVWVTARWPRCLEGRLRGCSDNREEVRVSEKSPYRVDLSWVMVSGNPGSPGMGEASGRQWVTC